MANLWQQGGQPQRQDRLDVVPQRCPGSGCKQRLEGPSVQRLGEWQVHELGRGAASTGSSTGTQEKVCGSLAQAGTLRRESCAGSEGGPHEGDCGETRTGGSPAKGEAESGLSPMFLVERARVGVWGDPELPPRLGGSTWRFLRGTGAGSVTPKRLELGQRGAHLHGQ